MHLLRIEKENHTPWFKIVTIEPSLVIDYRNILLVPQPVPLSTSSAAEATRFKQLTQNENFVSGLEIKKAATSSSPQTFFLNREKSLVEKIATTTKILAENVIVYHEKQNGTILFVDKNGFLAQMLPGQTPITILGRPGFFISTQPLAFVDGPRGETFVIDSGDGLFMLDQDDTLRPIERGVKALRFDTQGAKAILLKEDGITLFWLSDNPQQPFQKRGTTEKIISVNPLENKIKDARWFFGDDAHIVLRTQNGIFFTEIEGRGGRISAELFSGGADMLMTTPEKQNSIFFKKGEIIYRIDLR